MGFASTLFGKLDNFRESTLSSAMNSYAAYGKVPYTKAPIAVPVNPWSFYMLGNGAYSDRQATVASNGFTLDSVGGTIAPSTGSTTTPLSAPPSTIPTRRRGSTTTPAARKRTPTRSAPTAHGPMRISLPRASQPLAGRITVTAAPESSTPSRRIRRNQRRRAGKVGYLFDVGQVADRSDRRLTYARAKVNAYTETGDPVLTLTVGQQVAEALIGSVGAQFRFPFMVSGRVISPYVNLTMDDDFIGNGRIIQFGATSAPLIVNNWAVPNSTSQHVYGRVRGRRPSHRFRTMLR